MRAFVETFLFHFKEGSNGEYATASLPLFEQVKTHLEQVKTFKELGGHQSVWTVRAQIEKCKVYTAPTADQFTIDSITYKDGSKDFLHIPKQITS